eukprot:scaffold4050_cov55-Cylindrotheca_fusiformis.AAC.4
MGRMPGLPRNVLPSSRGSFSFSTHPIRYGCTFYSPHYAYYPLSERNRASSTVAMTRNKQTTSISRGTNVWWQDFSCGRHGY